MSRREFSKKTKREALKRSGGHCEMIYPGGRCNANLAFGVRFDHVIADSNGGEPTLENCQCLCTSCHNYKTIVHDTPRAAKIKRQSDKHRGIAGPKRKLRSRNTFKPYVPNVKQIRDS